MKINQLPIYFVLLLLFGGCSQMTFDDSVTVISKSIQDLRIAPGDTPITADEAINVARMFELNTVPQTKSAIQKEIKEIRSVLTKEGIPSMYVVNFENNGGFVVVGASRKYYPILAYSFSGEINESYEESGISIWIEEQMANIDYIEKQSKETGMDYSALWLDYESYNSVIHGTKTGDLLSVRASYIAQWEALGYSWTSLSDRPDGLPVSVYNNWCSSAAAIANPEYDYLENSIIFYKTAQTTYGVGPVTNTVWNQYYPYNSAMPLLPNGDPAYAGCVTIAVGQIMRYHQWPSSYSWSLMPNNTSNTYLSNYLRDVFDVVICSYDSNGSSAYFDFLLPTKIENNFDYSVTLSSHNSTAVKASLNKTIPEPVYMSGKPSALETGHSWVCDGYQGYVNNTDFVLAIISEVDPPLHYETLNNYNCQTGNGEYYSMKWGRYSSNDNGWFLDNYFGDLNYTTNRNDMFFTPN